MCRDGQQTKLVLSCVSSNFFSLWLCLFQLLARLEIWHHEVWHVCGRFWACAGPTAPRTGALPPCKCMHWKINHPFAPHSQTQARCRTAIEKKIIKNASILCSNFVKKCNHSSCENNTRLLRMIIIVENLSIIMAGPRGDMSSVCSQVLVLQHQK